MQIFGKRVKSFLPGMLAVLSILFGVGLIVLSINFDLFGAPLILYFLGSALVACVVIVLFWGVYPDLRDFYRRFFFGED